MKKTKINWLNGYKIKIVTRSMNRKLYKLSQKTIHLPFKRVRKLNTTADGYLYDLLKIDADYIINIDEDAFVLDNEKLLALLKYCIENDIDACCYPDGGVLSCRGHNPLVMNPFFNIFNIRKIKEKFSFNEMRFYGIHRKEYEKKTPFHLMKRSYQYDYFEPYCIFFVWLSQCFNVLYLNSEVHKYKLSSIANDNGNNPFLIHTWYSRNYGKDEYQTNRINEVIKECLLVKDISFKQNS